jgi:tRNA modification GTPase
MDTIFALATARGKAGVAVFRVSGPKAFAVAEALTGPLPAPRVAALRRVIWQGAVIDEGLVMCFAEGQSFTGEPVVEFQLHGSPAVAAAMLRILSGFEAVRMAEAGEFTRRALINGRMDLAQVEGLADLIEAETEAQRRQAERVMSGAVARRSADWRKALVRAAALVEATIDFVDEDVPVDVAPEVGSLLAGLMNELGAEIAGTRIAERVRDGFEVAIIGAPNVGKSTLLNALAGRAAALTSDIAGTTRDVIEVRMDLDGLPVTLLDTAGLRKTTDRLEAMGMDLAMARAGAADLRVFLLRHPEETFPVEVQPGDLVVLGKADVQVSPPGMAAVSGRTGAGLDALVAAIAAELSERALGIGTMVRARHREAMDTALLAIARANGRLAVIREEAEFVAADLWVAIRSLDMLIGKLDVENLLDEIFSSFCIGK